MRGISATIAVLVFVGSIAIHPNAYAAENAAGVAYVIPIKGDIEPSIAAFVRSETRRAQAEGAAFLVFEIDTFGGRVDTALQISSFIGSIRDAQTIAWVRSGPESMGVSWSAGALIALSCSRIYMADGTSMGAAAPVMMGPDGSMESAGEKTTSAVRTQMAALAEKNGHPPAIALAMVDADVELIEAEVDGTIRALTAAELERLEKADKDKVARGPIISPKGKLLSLTAREAERYGLSTGTVDELPQLLETIGAASEAIERTPTVADQIVAFLTSGPVQTLLILLGLVALFLEINSPGFGIPGVIAVVAFLGVFGANALLGSVGSLELILFLAGIGLLAVEIFVLPGFGVTGVSGLVLIAASLVFSMQDFIVPDLPWKWELFGRNVIVVASGLMAAVFGIAIIALAGPKLRMFDRLTLKTTIDGTAGELQIGPSSMGTDASVVLVGKRGVADSVLRPVGRARIEGHSYSVETDGEFVEEGTEIEVLRVQGNRITVTSVAARDQA